MVTYAFINLEPEGKPPARVRFDQIAAVADSVTWGGAPATLVTLVGGAQVRGTRPVDEVWAAMREAAEWLMDELVDAERDGA